MFSWLSSLFSKAETEAASAGVSVTAAGVNAVGITVTKAQVIAAYGALPSLSVALKAIIHGSGHLQDYETVTLDILAASAVIDPALAPEIGVLTKLAPYLIGAAMGGLIKGDPNPIEDAQTSHNFNPMDPARGGSR